MHEVLKKIIAPANEAVRESSERDPEAARRMFEHEDRKEGFQGLAKPI